MINKSKKARVDNYKLDTLLEYLDLPTKIDVDYTEMNNAFGERGRDISDYIAYCAFDTICLAIADDAYDMH